MEKKYEEAYEIHREKYLKLYNSFMKKGKFSNSNVLDAGCGTGRYTKSFSNEQCKLVVGLDKSLSMLKKAKQKNGTSVYVCGNIEYLPFVDESFDTIVMSQVIHWINCKEKAFSEVYRVLNNNGSFLLNTLSHKQLSNLLIMRYFPGIIQIEKERFPPIDELINMLKNFNFKNIEIEEIKEKKYCTIEELVNFAKDKATSALRIYCSNVGEKQFYKSVEYYKATLEEKFDNEQVVENHNYTLLTCNK